MGIIKVSGRITDEGKLEVTLPDGLKAGEVNVFIEITEDVPQREAPTWSEEEIVEMTTLTPMPGKEIATSLGKGWKGLDMTGAEWVEQQRNKRRNRRQW